MNAIETNPNPLTKIDPAKVKAFWELRGDKLGCVPFESIANLEEKPELLEMKTRLEQECILPLLPLNTDTKLLDLGAGVGQWSFRFAPKVRKVVAVEYAESLVNIGRAEAAKRGITNVEFVVAPAESYKPATPFDVVFISGLFVYLTDEQASTLMSHVYKLVKNQGIIILRDGTSILPHRHEIVDRFSETLQTRYSAIYRTSAEYREAFSAAKFCLIKEGQVFPEGCPLNKFRETRLRYYVFQPTN
jgi:cyclopropane fatty-acyl-phospholipid synthase-like methyltransferase